MKNNTQSAQSAVCSLQSAWSAFQHDRLNIEHGNINTVVLLDLKKAVDTVDHTLQLSKLDCYGITGPEGDRFG